MIALADALGWLTRHSEPLAAEPVALNAAAGRVLAQDVPGLPEPGRIAALDGLAVRAADTDGASEYTPLPISGAPIVAGMKMPAGTDAVLPSALMDEGNLALRPVAAGEGTISGETLGVAAGTVLRPTHLALLARLGCETVAAVRRPSVGLHVAGPKLGADALTPMLLAMIEAEGGRLAADAPDLWIHAGRSGPGPDDDGVRAFETLFAHGIAMRPGETAALGTVGGRIALLLPGEPLACATAFSLLAAPVLRQLGGRRPPQPVQARLSRKIVSGLGMLDAVRVRLEDGRATPLGPAEAITLSEGADADGLVLVPEGSEGYAEGATVWVHPVP